MKKLQLEIEALAVESFDTGADTEDAGTVRGNAATFACNTEDVTCDGSPTCDGAYTCNRRDYSCGLSCTACTSERCGA